RVLCCNSYLSEFAPVSIRMAKEQNLSLNPTKISGVCGRLMCCLKNEEETYEYLNSRLPGVGDTVTTQDGRKGEVQSVSVLRQKVKVIFEENEEKEMEEFDAKDLKFRPRRRKEKGGKNSNRSASHEEKELRDLEALEHKDGKSKSHRN
ncbi:MAG: stage 0 sporulation protein, partial [Lachnospiraceae bacterium]|nr:stage 0 sporulation protein [Lachnospiraceae bacterium]